jgi:hypothetical protein
MSAAASVKTASADSPIHEVLAERWSPYAFRDKPASQDELAFTVRSGALGAVVLQRTALALCRGNPG